MQLIKPTFNNFFFNWKYCLSVIKFFYLTDKTIYLFYQKKYSFFVHKKFNYLQLKFIFEYLFKIKIKKINILNLKIKKKYKVNSSYKKIIITVFKPINILSF